MRDIGPMGGSTSGPTVDRVETLGATLDVGREPMSYCFVRMTDSDGRVGWGECCDSYGCSYASVHATTIRDVIGPIIEGASLTSVEHLVETVRAATRRRLGDTWIVAQCLSGVEIALRDLSSQFTGIPIAAAGGASRRRVRVYAAGAFLEEATADEHATLFQPYLERGVTMVKVRIGPNWLADLETLRALRSHLGDDVSVAVDGSETFTASTALQVAHGLHDLGVVWFEEPVPQAAWSVIASLADRSPVPLAFGEHLFGRREAVELLARAPGLVLQPDAATCGGIGEGQRMAELAGATGHRVFLHNCAGPVALAANIHLAAAATAISAVEYGLHNAPRWEILGVGADLGQHAISDGHIDVPAGPGLGVAINEEVAAEHPYRLPGRRVAGTVGGTADRFGGDV